LAKLLVSVRSAVEARAAVTGGASIIDVKEPARGALGRADYSVWRAVRAVVPRSMPVSVALGELNEWHGAERWEAPGSAYSGVSFCKLGLSNAPRDCFERWAELRRHLGAFAHPGPAWVAVVYLDWESAFAPDPDAIIDEAVRVDECQAVLFDTWNKSEVVSFDDTWKRRIACVRDSGRLVALAGSLDAPAIARMAALEPDIFAVRGAACRGADRHADIDPERVATLVQAVNASTERESGLLTARSNLHC
jgi:uncharacterized protein (UPF0264 family)